RPPLRLIYELGQHADGLGVVRHVRIDDRAAVRAVRLRPERRLLDPLEQLAQILQRHALAERGPQQIPDGVVGVVVLSHGLSPSRGRVTVELVASSVYVLAGSGVPRSPP